MMKSLYYATIFFLLLAFSTNCSDRDIHSQNKFDAEGFYLLSDTLVKQETTLDFAYQFDSSDAVFYKNENLFSQIHFEYSEGIFRDTVVRLAMNNMGEACGKIIIPTGTCALKFDISTSKEILRGKGEMLPIYRPDGVLTVNAASTLMRQSSQEQYLSLFQEERKRYPDNILIFATRWDCEGRKNILSKDTIASNLAFIEERFSQNPLLPAIRVIAYSLLKKEKERNAALDTIINGSWKHAETLLNNAYISDWIEMMLFSPFQKEKMDTARCIQILKKHPTSYLSQNLLRFGETISTAFPKELVIESLNKQGIRNKQAELMARKAYALVKHFSPDSIEVALKIGQNLLALLKAERLFENGEDYYHFMEKRKLDIPLLIADCYDRKNQLDSALHYLQEGRRMLSVADSRNTMPLAAMSKIYEKLNKPDSARLCAFKALKYSAGYRLAKEQVQKYIATNIPKDRQTEAIEDSINKIPFDVVPLPPNFPQLKIQSKRFNLQKNSVLTVIEIIKESCSPCIHNIKLLDSLQKSGFPIQTFVLSQNLETVIEMFRKLNVKLYAVENGSEIIRSLHCGDIVGISFLIDKNGRILDIHIGNLTLEKIQRAKYESDKL